jgi:hypothetical protein
MNNLSAASCDNRRSGCGISPIFLILILCCCGGDSGGLFGGGGCDNHGGLEGILPIILILCCCGGSF